MSNWNVYSITCVYVTQTTIAVTILHTIHYSIDVLRKNPNKTDYWFSKYNRILHHYSVSTAAAAAAAAALCYRKWRHNRKWRQFRDRKWRHNRKWRQSRDRKCCLSFDLRFLIIPLVSFGHCVVCHLIYGLWIFA